MSEQSLSPNEVIAAAIQDNLREERSVRIAAWVASGGQLDDLQPAIIAALAHPVTGTRRRVLHLIPDLSSNNSVYRDAVVAALSDPAWSVREVAAMVAGQFSDPDGELLRTLIAMSLADPKPHVRRAAAKAAGPQIEPERDYGNAIRHQFERQRMRAALAVAHAPQERTAEVLQLLRVALADSHAKVRRAALQGLLLMPRVVVRSLLPVVARKCAEAESGVAMAARRVWDEVLHPRYGGEPLGPLQPFAGGADATGLQAMIGQLPADHLLRHAWESLPTQTDETPDPHRFARLLARLCECVLSTGTQSP
jgi:HEAT repeat protein